MPDLPDVRVTLYSRHGCPPCFALRRLARRASRRTGIPLLERDVAGDPELEARFGSRVPVLIVAGEAALQGRVGPAEVDLLFRRVAASARVRPSRWRRWLGCLGLPGGRAGGGPAA